jgi:hypothetical protein
MGTNRIINQENEPCPYIEQQVRVVVKDGNTAPQVRYIPQDQARLDKHKQLKQVSLQKRKQRQSEIKDHTN